MKYFFILALSLFLLIPSGIEAAGLVPCGGHNEPQCTTTHVVEFVAGLVNFLLSMLGVIAVIALVYTGFRMVISAGNESEWGKAKQMFTNIVIGIIIILAAWLVVDTILKGLTQRGLDEWTSELQVEEKTTSSPNQSTNSGRMYGFEERNGAKVYRSGQFSSLAECNFERNRLVAEYRRTGEAAQITVCYELE